MEFGRRGITKQNDRTATSWNIIKIRPLPITTEGFVTLDCGEYFVLDDAVELGRREINHTTVLVRHGILLKYIHFQSLRRVS